MNIKLPGHVQPVIVQDTHHQLRLLLYGGRIDLRNLYRSRPQLKTTLSPAVRRRRRLFSWPTSVHL
ncbi:MAG: hypothetical protein CMH57_13125 [Myxococcales bacterium]|nr:hypothetical protein [Myxococcales bacterium]